jgi:hypothetical protein
MKKFQKKALALFLLVALCLSCGIPAYAVTEKDSTELTSRMKDNSVVDLVCDTVTDYRIAYYDITDISGEVTSIEQTSDGANAVVNVDYSTKIKAETPDDSPYIKGIKAAIAELIDAEDIEEATTYLNMWCKELERDHIGKELPHHSEFKVFIPSGGTNNMLDINAADYLDKVSLADAQVMYREYDFVASSNNELSSNESSTADLRTYQDKPMDAFELPTDEEVMQNAYNAVYSIIGNDAEVARTSRAQELDRVAARDYARDEDNFPYNSDYNYYGDDGGDCANFVSQCYYEGGLSEDDDWYMYALTWINTGGSRSDYYGLSDYMQDYDIVFWVDGPDISRAFAGSIIYYQSGTTGGHVAIVTSNDGREMRYSAHTTDHCDEVMNQTWFSTNCDFLIPCWDSYEGVWTPQ